MLFRPNYKIVKMLSHLWISLVNLTCESHLWISLVITLVISLVNLTCDLTCDLTCESHLWISPVTLLWGVCSGRPSLVLPILSPIHPLDRMFSPTLSPLCQSNSWFIAPYGSSASPISLSPTPSTLAKHHHHHKSQSSIINPQSSITITTHHHHSPLPLKIAIHHYLSESPITNSHRQSLAIITNYHTVYQSIRQEDYRFFIPP